MSLTSLFSDIMEGRPNNLPGAFSEILQRQGVNMNDISAPAVDIVENTTTIIVIMNIPGVDTDSIDIDFFNNRILIKGNRPNPWANDINVRKSEIIYGQFERRVDIPISVTSPESITIDSEKGVLYITIDKSREERNRFSVRVDSNLRNTSTGSSHVKFNDTNST